MTIEKLGDKISYGIDYVETIEIPSKVYGSEPEYVVAVDIKPIRRKEMKAIFKKYGIENEKKDIGLEKADEMMVEVCKLGLVDQAIIAKIDDLMEFLPTKIGSKILELSTGSGEDMENFSKAKKA